LKIGLVIGQSDFRAEQKALVVEDDDDNGVIVDCRSSLSAFQLPGNLGLGLNAAQTEMESGPSSLEFHNEMPLGRISAVTIGGSFGQYSRIYVAKLRFLVIN
jgi:hypothetical protein